ncbi:histidine phosphatase family protein [Uruburuella testudinis]|uniref:phosphoglycerate mutase (2,3-diphosphoglycerate-dependent) n=1 Tax=Uruburuella testudinis TaxID=1282863 RepID=A0ABY4DTS4_9NEIS|nr:histidine phosphatase family protein [Uruburuella testudinis]UOO81823.1 histidine phosphatase family protein [Uruburuella testudinis]
MALNLYLVRHGRTEYNAAGRLQGWSDAPLTPEGREAAVILGRGLREVVRFDAAFCSTSPRAVTTARLILDAGGQPDLPVQQLADLREYSFGSFEGEKITAVHEKVMAHRGLPDVATWLAQYRHAGHNLLAETVSAIDPQGQAETEAAFVARLRQGMAELAAQSPVDGKVLLVSHGMSITAILKSIDPASTLYQSVPNVSVTRLDYENGVWRVLGVGDTSLTGNGIKGVL